MREKILKVLLLLSTCSVIATAEIIPIDKNIFYNTDTTEIHNIDSDFVLISLNERGAGRFYYVDAQQAGNSVVWTYRVAAGSPGDFDTPSGVFKIYHKKKKWMSTKYPEPSGINNMNYSMFFNGGIAMHQGSVNHLSHGCVHLRKDDAKKLFNNTGVGTPVIITRESYIPFLSDADYHYVFANPIKIKYKQ